MSLYSQQERRINLEQIEGEEGRKGRLRGDYERAVFAEQLCPDSCMHWVS